MLRNIFLVSLLIYSVCAVHWEIREVDSSEDLEEIPADGATAQKLPGVCWACKWIVKRVKKTFSSNSTPDEVKSKLLDACNQIGFLKGICRHFMQKYVSVLVEEISTSDDPNTVCSSLGVCKSNLPSPKKFILSSDRVFDHL